PHASVCGGRARCSTCRVRIVSDRGALPSPSGREAFVLARVGAGANPAIRLACQLRPHADVAVIPLLPANVGADFVRNRKRVNIGDIGFRDHTVFTALGDAVNVAARLQDMTKTLNCTVVVSEEVCKNAGSVPDTLMRTEVSIRGRDQPMTVCAAADPTLLAGLLDEQASSPGTERPVSAPGL